MKREADEIPTLYNTRAMELDVLMKRMMGDYGAWRLTPFTMEGDYQCVTSNDPRTLCDKVVDTLAYAPLRWEIASRKSGKKKRSKKSEAERLIGGCLTLADSRREAVVQPGIQATMSWLATVLGGFATRVWVHKEEDDGPTIPDIEVWDLLNTIWVTGRNGLAHTIHRNIISKQEAKEWGVEIEGKFATMYDYLDNEDNYIVIAHGKSKKNIHKEIVQENKVDMDGHCPVMISLTGAVPMINMSRFTDTLKDVGESVMAADRGLYPMKNKLLTLYMTIVSLGAHNPLAITSEGGKRSFSKDPYYAGSIVQLDGSKGEKVEPLYKPEAPQNTADMLNEVMREISMGGLAPIAHGQVDVALPGYGMQLLTHNTSSVINPRKHVVQKALSWTGRELLTQFASGGFKAIKVYGRDNTNEQYMAEIKASDIQGDWFPEAVLDPKLPENEAEQMVMAQMAVINRLMSHGEAREKILKIRDSEASEDRIISEDMDKMPGVMLQRMIKIAKDNNEPELAAVLPMLFGMLQPQIQGMPGAGEEGRTSFEGVVDPNAATGVRPEVYPGQQMGAANTLAARVAENMRLSRSGLVRGR